ncbi:MAG: hypothetical protein K1X61_05900 [Chitinophagales bacterium]|nr:hypothetical protein [Chitinophagales bacterium]
MKTFLNLLLGFVAMSATFSGLLLIIHPDGSTLNLSTSLLSGTPFNDFSIPGLILSVVVGGTHLAAIVQNMKHATSRYNWSMAAGIVLAGWIIVQLLLIGETHWLQLLYLVIGALTIFASYQLKGKWAV